MGIGARDYIDKLLVQKYAEEQVDNHNDNALISKVDADNMLAAMENSANQYRNMLALNDRLTTVCYGVVAKSARYKISNEDAA